MVHPLHIYRSVNDFATPQDGSPGVPFSYFISFTLRFSVTTQFIPLINSGAEVLKQRVDDPGICPINSYWDCNELRHQPATT